MVGCRYNHTTDSAGITSLSGVAGRMVKEGDKTYAYGYLDKILSVQENGEKTAAFDYHVDGQIASATHGDKSENFLWDGLSLIHRSEPVRPAAVVTADAGGTSYINEPYVTGGNPILSSKDGVMFNDMLGNSLNIGGKSVSMTAFGETADKSAMLTGKPYIGEMGYAFLFRNYRADQGKWNSADPLGYPDGWNNLAYCNNRVTYAYDNFGAWLGIDDCVAMLTGAVIGASIQTVSNIIQGKDTFDGVAQAAAVGMVSAEAGLYGGPIAGAAAGAATNAALSAIQQGIDSYYTGSDINTTEILENAALDFTSSVATAVVLPPGSISGQGSITAVSKQMMTKLKNGTIQNMKNTTQIKTLIGNIIGNVPDSILDAIYRPLLNLSQNVQE